jgi:hypothetical protein
MKETFHELKTDTDYFGLLIGGLKSFEVRRDDRGFKAGDVLILREYDPVKKNYTGRVCTRQVNYILRLEELGFIGNYCVMAIKEY